MGSTILATGHYVPDRIVTSAELESGLGLAPGWIERRTGIRERRYAAPDEALSDMAVAAGEAAFSKLGFTRDRIALLILATSTPDHLLPPSAPLVAHRLGLKSAGAIDMAGACAGFIHALTYADAFARIHDAPVLVIAANLLSRRTNMAERASAILFADAAGAAVIAPSANNSSGVRGVHLASDGSGYDLIKIPAGGSRRSFSSNANPQDTLMHISDGRAVFSRAVDLMVTSAQIALDKAGLTLAGITYCVPHQANARILSAVQLKLHLPPEKILASVELYGNSSAATIPLTLSLSTPSVSFRPGDKLLLCAAGAGMTGGALVYEL